MSRTVPRFLIHVVEALPVKTFFYSYFQKTLTSYPKGKHNVYFPPIADRYWRVPLRESNMCLWTSLVLFLVIFIFKKIVIFII